MLVGDLYSLTPAGSVPFQPGPGDRIGLRAGAGGALARHLEHRGPAVQHREQGVAALHVGDAEHPRLLADVEERGGVERVGIRRRDVPERRVRDIARSLMIWPIGAVRADRRRDVGDDPARHLHRHQRIAEDVGVGGKREVFEPFADAQELAEFGMARCAHGCAGEQADAADRYVATGDIHGINSVGIGLKIVLLFAAAASGQGRAVTIAKVRSDLLGRCIDIIPCAKKPERLEAFALGQARSSISTKGARSIGCIKRLMGACENQNRVDKK